MPLSGGEAGAQAGSAAYRRRRSESIGACGLSALADLRLSTNLPWLPSLRTSAYSSKSVQFLAKLAANPSAQHRPKDRGEAPQGDRRAVRAISPLSRRPACGRRHDRAWAGANIAQWFEDCPALLAALSNGAARISSLIGVSITDHVKERAFRRLQVFRSGRRQALARLADHPLACSKRALELDLGVCLSRLLDRGEPERWTTKRASSRSSN